MTPGKKIALFAAIAVFALTWIHPHWPLEQAMHGSLAVVGLVWLWLHDRRWPIRTRYFVGLCAFIGAHCIAARWLYSNVPYETWFQAAFGWSPAVAFGWHRNHADRVIHFLYGLSLAPVLRDWLGQKWPLLGRRQAFVLAVMSIMCSSLIYEWFEWAVALTMSPDAAESYNGQQGDIWDAHADMLLATLGSLFAWPFKTLRA